MFEKILIANRGEIAVRVIKTCDDLGLDTVAVYSDSDKDALHTRRATEAYRIGPSRAQESYLRSDAIIDAALRSGAQAIHPGYGFLAESPEFAEACVTAGLIFIGPSAQVLRLIGDKASAKRIAESEGVPLLAGHHDADQGDELLSQICWQIGFPIMVKATRGGGGIGMRLVREQSGLSEAIQAVRREAMNFFGDSNLIVEKFLEQPRHVEIQIIGDSYGNILNLGERECSIQRLYQKVIEESPSLSLDADLYHDICDAAVRIARSSGYYNAGTVEFLVDRTGAFYFLEINPRLQVEHPVTEWRLGLDLVGLQIKVAANQPLPIRQVDLKPRGHVIEARVYAEDPTNGYLPGAGILRRFQPPDSPWVRNDVGVYEGEEVSVHYDSLLGKLVIFGADRSEAIARLTQALSQYVVQGIPTNIAFLRSIVTDDDFISGNFDTDFVRRRIEPLFCEEVELLPTEALISAIAQELLTSGCAYGYRLPSYGTDDDYDPWQLSVPWRLGGLSMRFQYTYLDKLILAYASRCPGLGLWEIQVSEKAYKLGIEIETGGKARIIIDGKAVPLEISFGTEGIQVLWESKEYLLRKPASSLKFKEADIIIDTQYDNTIQAPMPGRVVDIRVAPGDAVSTHQVLLVLEAMKMEHLVSATHDGVVYKVYCQENQQVTKGDVLMEVTAI